MRLTDCMFNPTHDCLHSEDAGVDCSTECEWETCGLLIFMNSNVIITLICELQ